ncbi:hypothetical protein HU200_024422 [Digitaria exilis]|uniref:Uncharacterized protein n=1 Tax=Digitaria exilis TaxID=1010633 RepID=A0A835CAJ7_9POAL|nr:hypothetical protein HU200_024422 [Digitaria exilis]
MALAHPLPPLPSAKLGRGRRLLLSAPAPGLPFTAARRHHCRGHPHSVSLPRSLLSQSLLVERRGYSSSQGPSPASSFHQWYPGHIAKTEKELKEQLRLMDVVIEIRDARIPLSTSHPKRTGMHGLLTLRIRAPKLSSPMGSWAWWVRFGTDLELLDSPGILPMRISDQTAAIKLAICDDIGERSYDFPDVAAILVQMLIRHPAVGPEAFQRRYRIDVDNDCGKMYTLIDPL